MDELRAAVSDPRGPDPSVLDELAKTAGYLDQDQLGLVRRELLPVLLAHMPGRTPVAVLRALLRDSGFAESLEYLPELIGPVEGSLELPDAANRLDPAVLTILADKATAHDVGAPVLKAAVSLTTNSDTPLESLAAIETLAAKLARWHALAPLVPFHELYTGSPELQSRLMVLTKLLARYGDRLEPSYIMWPLDDPAADDLMLMLRAQYLADLVAVLPAAAIHIIEPAIHVAARIYPGPSLLRSDLESVLVALGTHHGPVFMALDGQYSLVQPDRLSLLARLPAAYIAQHHPSVVEALELSERSLPAFCNLATDPKGYRLLTLPAARISALTLPSKALLAIAATRDPVVAGQFAVDHPSVVAALAEWKPMTLEASQQRQELQDQLWKAGIRLRRQPQVAAAASY